MFAISPSIPERDTFVACLITLEAWNKAEEAY
jgi:hypothetical protein